jgi:ABC-type branched-subunit amino acid transport system substrate-binding protein
MTMNRLLATLAAAALAAAASGPAAAAKAYGPGVSDTEIRLGQTVPLSGPVTANSIPSKAEAAYLKMINEQGGINGRKVTLVTLDDAYSPPKTVEQTRRLIEQENVLAIWSSVGTSQNLAVVNYINGKKVPHLLLLNGASPFINPSKYPWTSIWQPAYKTEARTWAHDILSKNPNARIAVLYQNDDYGKDFLNGFKETLGDKAQQMIVAVQSYETSDPTVDSQILALQGSGANTFVNISTGKFAAQAIRKAADSGWKPTQYVSSSAMSIEVILKPAGLDKAAGIMGAQFVKDPSDPRWADDPGVKEYLQWAQKYFPEENPKNILVVYGYSEAQTLVHLLKQCGDNLTRENIRDQAQRLKGVKQTMLLPGIEIGSTPARPQAIRSMQLMRFDGQYWAPMGSVINDD